LTYEYGVVIRRQRRGQPAVWQFWIGEGCVHEDASFLATMNWAGERGFEAFAAGNFDELGVPEVILKRALPAPPPPALPEPTGAPGAELGGGDPPAAERPQAKPRATKGAAKRPAKSPA
jgi:hypothetical protein